MVLETGSKNPEALALYRSRGYTPIESFGPYAGMPDSFCFSRSLA
jgi:ribosomal protein S18 acetylase RimI-like enzyme